MGIHSTTLGGDIRKTLLQVWGSPSRRPWCEVGEEQVWVQQGARWHGPESAGSWPGRWHLPPGSYPREQQGPQWRVTFLHLGPQETWWLLAQSHTLAAQFLLVCHGISAQAWHPTKDRGTIIQQKWTSFSNLDLQGHLDRGWGTLQRGCPVAHRAPGVHSGRGMQGRSLCHHLCHLKLSLSCYLAVSTFYTQLWKLILFQFLWLPYSFLSIILILYIHTCNMKYMKSQVPPNCHQYVHIIRKKLSRNIDFSPLWVEVLKHLWQKSCEF